MSRKIKLGKTDKRRFRQQATQRQKDIDLIRDTAATFSCSTEITKDFLFQCTDGIEAIEADLNFNRVAHEFWQDRPGHGQQIAEALAAFIHARESYLRAPTDLRLKLTDLAAQVPEHDHLDPIEKYREIVRARMFADVARLSDLDSAPWSFFDGFRLPSTQPPAACQLGASEAFNLPDGGGTSGRRKDPSQMGTHEPVAARHCNCSRVRHET